MRSRSLRHRGRSLVGAKRGDASRLELVAGARLDEGRERAGRGSAASRDGTQRDAGWPHKTQRRLEAPAVFAPFRPLPAARLFDVFLCHRRCEVAREHILEANERVLLGEEADRCKTQLADEPRGAADDDACGQSAAGAAGQRPCM